MISLAKPLLLDLFCCAGGAAKGYAGAGFDVVGVDVKPQPRYPFKFCEADALDMLDDLLNGYDPFGYRLADFDAIHASPPCQTFSGLSNAVPGTKDKYPDLIEPVRSRLKRAPLPYVIENVAHAPLPSQDTLDGSYGVELCGTMFGRRLQLHRLFETSIPLLPPRGCDHSGYVLNPYNVAGRARIRAEFPDETIAQAWRREKGVEWMNGHEASEAIMPAYTEYIGVFLMLYCERRLEAA